jgi:hypothetical protein
LVSAKLFFTSCLQIRLEEHPRCQLPPIAHRWLFGFCSVALFFRFLRLLKFPRRFYILQRSFFGNKKAPCAGCELSPTFGVMSSELRTGALKSVLIIRRALMTSRTKATLSEMPFVRAQSETSSKAIAALLLVTAGHGWV